MGRISDLEIESSKVGSFSQEEKNPEGETHSRTQKVESGEVENLPDLESLDYGEDLGEDSLESVFFKANPDAKYLKSGHPGSENLQYGFKQKDSNLSRRDSCGSAKKKKQVFLEGYVEPVDEDDLTRTKSLTDEDLDELKGCLDLGFGFSYEEIPELCNTLPALELCYSMSQKYLDEQQRSPDASVHSNSSPPSGPIANWKISSPGDHPEEVKARLKFWAQTVACTVRLCS